MRAGEKRKQQNINKSSKRSNVDSLSHQQSKPSAGCLDSTSTTIKDPLESTFSDLVTLELSKFPCTPRRINITSGNHISFIMPLALPYDKLDRTKMLAQHEAPEISLSLRVCNCWCLKTKYTYQSQSYDSERELFQYMTSFVDPKKKKNVSRTAGLGGLKSSGGSTPYQSMSAGKAATFGKWNFGWCGKNS